MGIVCSFERDSKCRRDPTRSFNGRRERWIPTHNENSEATNSRQNYQSVSQPIHGTDGTGPCVDFRLKKIQPVLTFNVARAHIVFDRRLQCHKAPAR